jgi:UDP-4-amino-4,6-dideoxy-N-acetyl-beta-L-altrosamine transaminase
MIPYGRQSIDQSDIDAVVEVLTSRMLTQGDCVPRFEQVVLEHVGSVFAVAVCNATAALHLAYLALGLGPGDLLWTVPNTFVATSNAALFCGAEVDFIDIDPRTFLMDTSKLEEKLVAAEADGRLPKIVVPVHFAGQSCDMRQIGLLAKRFGFRVVEDAAHAVGASYHGEPVGNCRYSDLAIFSFHPVKIVTTGEGGMCLTNDPALADKLRLLRSHGITKDNALFVRPSDGPWDYRQIALGFNYRMTDIQAALGIAQFARLPAFLARRRAIVETYDAALANSPIALPQERLDALSAWHLYIVSVDPSARRTIFEQLQARDIGVQVLYIPVHRQPYYEMLGFRAGSFPVAEAFYERSFTLPIYPTLSEAEQAHVIKAVREIVVQTAK